MEEADFVADSDEDEQELLEQVALAEEQHTRERLEAAAAAAAAAAAKSELEPKRAPAAVVTPEKPPTVQERPEQAQAEAETNEVEEAEQAVEELDEEVEVTDEEEEDDEEEEEQLDENAILEVRTVVTVDSRTWPGINKLGGSGHVVRVHREPAEDGASENIFYDVRYVLGGFEKHIESKYVHSSKILEEQSNRERVDREYYHDDYINKPHEKKQRDAERKRVRALAHPERAEAHAPLRKKRKHSHRAERAERVPNDPQDEVPHSGDERDTRHKVAQIDEDAFILSEAKKPSPSLEDSSRPPSDSGNLPGIQSPPLRRPRGAQRRRHRILDSDDESGEESDKSDRKSVSPERAHRENLHPSASPSGENAVRDTEKQKPARRHRPQKRKRTARRQRYVGGYEHNTQALDDPDANFIQPEGNPTDLPEDVIRKTGIKLAKTKDGLMKQLQKVFAQQQKHLDHFHGEQKVVNQKFKNLAGMASDDLQALHKKVCELKDFVTTTLVNAGEDVMNKIIDKLEKRGKIPSALESLVTQIDEWVVMMNECSPWVRNSLKAVENAFARRNEEIPAHSSVQAVYSSESGDSDYSADDIDGEVLVNKATRTVDSVSDELDFSYDYEPARNDFVARPNSNSKRQSNATKRVSSSTTEAMKKQPKKKVVTSTTLDDYFAQGSGGGFRSNLRLIGKQKNILPSDPRWNWAKIARKKQQRAGGGTRERSGGMSSSQLFMGVNSRHEIHEPRPSRRDDSASVQIERLHLRDNRFRRSKPAQQGSREPVFARSPPQAAPATMLIPDGIPFDDVAPAKSKKSGNFFSPMAPSGAQKEPPVDWNAVFEVVSDGTGPIAIGGSFAAITRQQQDTLLSFGHPICGPLAPRHLLCDEDFDFEELEVFRGVVQRRSARLRQLLNDLRVEEHDFMESLSRGSFGAIDEEGYATAPEWISLVSLEERYNTAIASFSVQILQALESASPSALASHLEIILQEVSAIIRQLPDCEALFGGCKAYFFFFEVASRDAATTPLLTAISRAYWYCLNLLSAVQSACYSRVDSQAVAKQGIYDLFFKKLPVNRVTLAVVLFLFDLYLYLPTSHHMGDAVNSTGALPALSLWLLVRDCAMSSAQTQEDSRVSKEKNFWALLQAVYQQRYFDELARCFVQNESCGGYLRDFTPKISSGDVIEHLEEKLESQLLAAESMWDLLAVLTRVYADEENKEGEDAISDARWAVVKDLLHPDKRNFLPFDLSTYTPGNLLPDYDTRSSFYMHHVLKRIATFSKWWHPSKDIVEIVVKQLWNSDVSNDLKEAAELPNLLKQFATHCRGIGNSKSQLTAFAESCCGDDEPDVIATLCEIIWIQLLKLDKRVHRGRFRQSIIRSIPAPSETSSSATSPSVMSKPSGTDWNWGPKCAPTTTQQAEPQSGAELQQDLPITKSRKARTRIAVLLTFAVVGVCMECGDEQRFPSNRNGKDLRYMEREIDYYCVEILRGTSGRLHSEVIVAQALYTLGALLLERNSTEFPLIFRGLNDRLEASVKNLHDSLSAIPAPSEMAGTRVNASKKRSLERRRRQIQSSAMSSLYLIRDLVQKMITMPSSGVSVGQAYGPAVEKSLEHIFSSGMEACLNGVIQKVIPVKDLKIAMEIFQLVLPRAQDKPQQCLALIETPQSEFDIFDDGLATFDLEAAIAGHQPAPAPVWTASDCRPKVIQLVTNNLRVAVQQLVLNYPQSDAPAFDELYAIDLLGMVISTCEVQFFWSNVTSALAKPRNLAPRVLSATLKYNSEKEWLGNAFLRESGSDHELASSWLLGTLDVATFNSTPIACKVEDAPFSLASKQRSEGQEDALEVKPHVRDSDSWIMLTDGIIYHLLRKDPVGICTMDPQILSLLREVASSCKFPTAVHASTNGLHDVETLYDLHLDVFQSFARSAGKQWRSLGNLHDKNQFRTKLMSNQFGIFISFLDAFKINFRRACTEIDRVNHKWHAFSELFLRQAGVNATGGRSYHEMDDTIKSFDERLTGLTTMFRFMYQCMDAFMFYCGEMAIGKSNLFFDAMQLLFRQVNSAEYPQAEKRMDGERTLDQQMGVRNVNEELRKGFCTGSMGFVDSVQLFFARQKYPSLLHWFAQTSEIYQTFGSGWNISPLKTLLVNILDPDGPLGIHSYYPGDQSSNEQDVDVRTVRREAFYLSCGLFDCRCTKSFEHSRATSSCSRVHQLRQFVLDDFMRDTFTFVQREGMTSLLETMVPLFQLVRAVLNHANLNANLPSQTATNTVPLQEFQLNELHPCLEWMVECLIKFVPGEDVVNSTISCVLLTELCGIVCEAIAFNEHRPKLELIDLVELVLVYLQSVYVALSRRTTTMMSPLFAPCIEYPPSVKLSEYRFSRSGFRDIVVERGPSGPMDSYEISLARAATDLLAAIGRVAQQCQASSDDRLRYFTTVAP